MRYYWNVEIDSFDATQNGVLSLQYEQGGGFKHFLFSILLGEMIQFDEHFWDGLKPPTSEDFE